MEELHRCVEGVVTAGIRAYIGLLACGEKERSRRVLSDTMQISSIASGGPSARIQACAASAGSAALARLLIFFTLRSLLASLLVLRATAYWSRVPALADLQEACGLLNRCLGEGIAEAAMGGGGGAVRDEVGEARRRLAAGEQGPGDTSPSTGDDEEAGGAVAAGGRSGGPGSPGSAAADRATRLRGG